MQIGWRYRCSLRRQQSRRSNRKQFIIHQMRHLHPRIIPLAEADGQVQRRGVQVLQLIAHRQPQLDLRAALAKMAQSRQ